MTEDQIKKMHGRLLKLHSEGVLSVRDLIEAMGLSKREVQKLVDQYEERK